MNKFILLKTPNELSSLNESQVSEINGVIFNKQNKDMKTFHEILSSSQNDEPLSFESVNLKLSNSLQKASALESLESDLANVPMADRIRNNILTSSNEIIMNAFFDAPKKNNVSLYSQTPRDKEVLENVKVSWKVDGNYFKLLVEDSYGSLDKHKLYRHLAKGYQNDKYVIDHNNQGAGIGLRQSLERGTSLIFKVQPNKITQVMALFKLSPSIKEIKEWSNFLITVTE